MEDSMNTVDIEKLSNFYKDICTSDFTYVEEYIGITAHPMKDRDNIVEYKGYEKIVDVAANWSVALPDMIFKFTNIEVKDEGSLVFARWECNGTKIANVKYPDIDRRDTKYQLESSKATVENNVEPDISLFGTALFYITDDDKLSKMKFVVHTEK